MFAYCNNNPAMCTDSCGTRPTWLEYDFGNGLIAYTDSGQGRFCEDITSKMTIFMKETLKEFDEYKSKYGIIKTWLYFYDSVGDGKRLDIKLQDDWEFKAGTSYIFRDTVLRYDDPGNIVFGYVGASLFPCTVLCAGAGANQISKYGFKFGDISTFFDDPRDNEMIKWGYYLYYEDTHAE